MFRCCERQLVVVELGLTAASNCAFNVKSDGLVTPYVTPSDDPLDLDVQRRQVTPLFRDMKVCNITGSRAVRGSVIHRRGLAKKKGGVGRHITKMVPRIFAPNLQSHRIWVPELKKFVRIRVTARGLKTINKQGAYKALKKVGAI
jgi:large subunit ribosomal protein L28